MATQPSEKIARLGLPREEGFMYFVKAAAVWRTRSPKQPGEKAEQIAVLGVEPEPGYTYFLDQDGDIARVARAQAPSAEPVAAGGPVTFADAFAPLRGHVGAAIFLELSARVGGLRPGRRAITVIDWTDLDADTRAQFVEDKLLMLARALGGRGWDVELVPIALVGGESHPVPLDELDQQGDGVLLVDLRTGAVMYCTDATSEKVRLLAASTAALVVHA